MQKLSKEQAAKKAELVDKLSTTAQELQDAITSYNEKCEAEFGSVKEALTAYQEAVAEAQGFAEEVASDIGSYMDEKSEKWLESERGQAYEQWKGDWENAYIPEADIDEPTSIECDVDEMAGSGLDELSEEVGI